MILDWIIAVAIVVGLALFAHGLRRPRPRVWGELDSAHVARALTRRHVPPRTIHVGRWLQ